MNKIVSISVVFFIEITAVPSLIASDRTLIFINDNCIEQYSIDHKIDQFGPMVGALIIALQEKANPILVSTSLWNNFIKRKNFFGSNKRSMGSNSDHMWRLYKQVNTALTNMYQSEKVWDENVPLEQMYDQLIEVSQNPEFCFNKQCMFGDVYKRTIQNLITYITELNPAEWDVYTVDDFYYLLIPKAWQERIQLDSADFQDFLQDERTTIFKNSTKPEQYISLRELITGFKIDSLDKVDDPLREIDEKIIRNSCATIEDFSSINDLLSKVFVTKKDVHEITYLPSWYIYISGHGVRSDISPLIREQWDRVENLERTMSVALPDQDYTTFRSQLMELAAELAVYEKASLMEDFHIQEENTKKRFKKLLMLYGIEMEETSTKTVAKLLELIELKKNLNDAMDQIIVAGKGLIVGFSLAQFKNVLQFLNNNINTKFFYYRTCYGGGINLNLAYLTKGITDVYNYTIVSGALTDASTRGVLPTLIMPPYCRGFSLLPSDVKVAAGDRVLLKVQVHNMSFKKFFEALIGEAKLQDALNYVGRFYQNQTLITPENIPLIRMAGSTEFSVVPLTRKWTPVGIENISLEPVTVAVTPTLIRSLQQEDKPLVIGSNTAVLLYPQFITIPIRLQGTSIVFVPQDGIRQDTVLQEIDSDLPLEELIAAFLVKESPMSFFIDRFKHPGLLLLDDVGKQFIVHSGTAERVGIFNKKSAWSKLPLPAHAFWYQLKSGKFFKIPDKAVFIVMSYGDQYIRIAYDAENKKIKDIILLDEVTSQHYKQWYQMRTQAIKNKVTEVKTIPGLSRILRAYKEKQRQPLQDIRNVASQAY